MSCIPGSRRGRISREGHRRYLRSTWRSSSAGVCCMREANQHWLLTSSDSSMRHRRHWGCLHSAGNATQLNSTQRNARAVVLEGDEDWVVGGEERRVFDGENHVAKRDLCAHGLPVRYDRLLVLALPVPAVDLDAPARNTRDTSHSASAQLHCSSHATGFVISDPFLVFLLRTLFARNIIQDGK